MEVDVHGDGNAGVAKAGVTKAGVDVAILLDR